MKKALLVGINDYPGKQNDLMGCVNDVHNMQDLLVSLFGFPPENITIMTDRDATTENILEALDLLVSSAKPADQIVFHFSGHGSQVSDKDGDEPDRCDEIICPYDLDWQSKVIRDDDLSRIFKSIKPGVHAEVFLDCCHSGTGLRGAGGKSANYMRRRFLSPPDELLPQSQEPGVMCLKAIRPAKIKVLWAACRSDQYAADALLDGRYGGAFTSYLCNCIRQAKGNINRNEVLKLIRKGIRKGGFIQVPQLETVSKFKKARILAA
ncbi:MAG TPA: caspase family protein [Syntrophobacteraceae bacterium]|nr:caspase family protein [Syntrophobacteraceae bacterium]